MSEHLFACVSWLADMESLSDSERGRLFTALLKYAATGAKEEPRGSERVLFHKFCADAHDAQYIYINTKNTQSQVSDSSTSNLSSYTESSFESFWNAWPSKYKVNRKRCFELWQKIKPDEALVDKMLCSIEAWKKGRQWQQGYVPNPDTWLRNEKWNDADPEPWKDQRRNTMGHYANERPLLISEEEFEKLAVNFDEIRLD